MSFSHPNNPIDFLANHISTSVSNLSQEAIDIITENFGKEDLPNWIEMDSVYLLALHSSVPMSSEFNPSKLEDVQTWMFLEEGYSTIYLDNGNRVALNVREMEYTLTR